MDIYVYSDESGVFDKNNYRFYTYGGLVFLSVGERDSFARRYLGAENNIRIAENASQEKEMKASNISPESRRKLYRVISKAERFGAIIDLSRLTKPSLFKNKKTKQRYLDWAFKMAVKMKFEDMIRRKVFRMEEVSRLHFFTDEHTTATAGIYELKESLETEFKSGVWTFESMTFREPLFPDLISVELNYCDSAKTTVVRAADIMANRLNYYAFVNNGQYAPETGLHVFYHP